MKASRNEISTSKSSERFEELVKQLPVTIGSDVYFIPSKANYDLNVLYQHEENNKVYHQKVEKIVFTERGWYLECNLNLKYGIDHIFVDKLYQETWFTSPDEAERALSALKEYKNPKTITAIKRHVAVWIWDEKSCGNLCPDYQQVLKQEGKE